MDEFVASTTALGASLMRALHTRADPEPILDDPWGDQLVPRAAVDALREHLLSSMSATEREAAEAATESVLDNWMRNSPAYANVLLRSRYTEDSLNSAIEHGTTQYVLIGAGFDSYALRKPPAAEKLAVYEIDHPTTQSLKKRRLAECEVLVGDSVHFLAADLSKEGLGAVLSRSSFQPTALSFFSLLGVTMYLTREANLATLGAIAASGAPGSEVVFSYLDQGVLSAGSDLATKEFVELQERVRAMGEPFVSGFDPKTLAHDLRDVGLQLEEDITVLQVLERYDASGANGLRPGPQSRIARARSPS